METERQKSQRQSELNGFVSFESSLELSILLLPASEITILYHGGQPKTISNNGKN